MGLKLTVPAISHFILTEAPTIWTFLLACFTPPYLYLLLNLIIITILITSKFHFEKNHFPPEESTLLPPEPTTYNAAYGVTVPPVQIPTPEQTDYAYEVKTTLNDETVAEGNDSVAYVSTPVKTTVVKAEEDVVTPILQRKISSNFAFNDENEKPPVSARFSHRKAVRASPEGGKMVALGVTKSKKQDTLESTWKTITEGRAMPLNRHLKKSETLETQPRRNAVPLADLNGGPVMKKSETFSSRENSVSPGSGGKLRKESSLSQDDLNRRVEAFINKFNAEMRMQRQESLRQYREMVNRRTR